MKRLFLISLLLYLLLAGTAVQHTLSAPLVGNDKMVGGIPVADMVFALPAGIYAAGLIVIGIGIGAEFWRALLPICGAGWIPTTRLEQLSRASLWCGWLTLGTCCMALPCIFPQLQLTPPPTDSILYSAENYRLLLAGGFITMLASRLLNTYLPTRGKLIIVLMSAGVGLMVGQYWWNGLPVDYLAMALLLPVSLILCVPSKQLPASSPFLWIHVTALALVLYATAFSQLILSYPAGPVESTPGWLSVKFTANTLLMLTLIAMLTPALRKHRLTQQIAGGASVLAVILFNWSAIAGPLDTALQGTLPLQPAGTVYCILLCILTVLIIFCMHSYSPQTSQKK